MTTNKIIRAVHGEDTKAYMSRSLAQFMVSTQKHTCLGH